MADGAAGSLARSLVFPPPPQPPRAVPSDLEIDCPVCGERSFAVGFSQNVRESGRCTSCGAWNRLRQLALVVAAAVEEMTATRVRSLADLDGRPRLVVFNTESRGPVHDRLSRVGNYLCSEYFGDGIPSGAFVDGTMHQDLMSLSFPDESIDLVVSTDVFEHVADPYVAHHEVLRVLRPGGRHVFTVPFDERAFSDQVRASIGPDGELVHHLPPQYHEDPVRPEGVLVFTIFGLQMLVELDRLGFDTRMYRLDAPEHGIVGPAGLVFDAVRRQPSAVGRAGRSDLTVVLPVEDGADTTLTSLAALAALDDLAFELVVVDDACLDATPALLASLEGDVRLLRNRQRLGRSASYERGLGVASGHAVVLLEQGAELEAQWLHEALADLDQHPVASPGGETFLLAVDWLQDGEAGRPDGDLIDTLRGASQTAGRSSVDDRTGSCRDPLNLVRGPSI